MDPVWLITVLAISVLFIILGTTKLKIHPFLVLLLASYLAGALAGLPLEKIAATITTGFGNIMASIGIVIVLGTIIGIILEKSNAAIKLAELVLKLVGKRFPALAMSIIGYIVSIPVFCDSAFVILSSLKKSLVQKTGAGSFYGTGGIAVRAAWLHIPEDPHLLGAHPLGILQFQRNAQFHLAAGAGSPRSGRLRCHS